MEPINFEGTNIIFGPPKGMTEDQVKSVYARREGDYVTVCWKLDKEDLEEIQRTGRVYVSVMGVLPPHFLSTQP